MGGVRTALYNYLFARKHGGQFLLRIEDNMESIGRAVNSALQLSKRGGGVAFLLSNLREAGAPQGAPRGERPQAAAVKRSRW